MVAIARGLTQPLLTVIEGRVLPEDREVLKTLLASCEVREVTFLDRRRRVSDNLVLIHAWACLVTPWCDVEDAQGLTPRGGLQNDDSAPRKDSNKPTTRGTRMGHAIGLLAIGKGLVMRRDQRVRSRVPTSHLAIGATAVRSTRVKGVWR